MKKLTLPVILIPLILLSCDFGLGSDPNDQNNISVLSPFDIIIGLYKIV